MGYSVIIEGETIEIHSDMCDRVFEKKDNIFSKNLEFVNFNFFEEVEEFIKDKENIVFCDECKPESKEYDEEYDDFYEEFDEDENIDEMRCDIF